MKTSPHPLPPPLFKILSTPLPPPPTHAHTHTFTHTYTHPATPNPTPSLLSVVLFLWLNRWSRHIWCAIVLNDNIDLHMSSLSTRRTLMCVFCNNVSSLLSSDILWFLLVLWFDITYTQTHTTHPGVSRLSHPYKYIFTPPVMCSQQLPLLH